MLNPDKIGFSINIENLGEEVMHHVKYLETTKYNALRGIGAGSEGAVFLAENRYSKRIVAIKLSYVRNNSEFCYWGDIRNQNCLQLFDKFEYDNVYYYVMEYAENRTMFDWIQSTWHCCRNDTAEIPNEDLLRLWSAQLVDSVRYLHHFGFFHLDIKPDNIFLDRNWNVKLGDFGFLRCMNDTSTPVILGCPCYRPPEGLVKKYTATGNLDKVDVWSLGCTILELVSGKLISAKHFQELDLSITSCKKNIQQNILKLDELDVPYKEGFALIKLLLQVCPADRPSAKDIVRHPWLRINWAALEKPTLCDDIHSGSPWLNPFLNNQAIAKVQEFGCTVVERFADYFVEPGKPNEEKSRGKAKKIEKTKRNAHRKSKF